MLKPPRHACVPRASSMELLPLLPFPVRHEVVGLWLTLWKAAISATWETWPSSVLSALMRDEVPPAAPSIRYLCSSWLPQGRVAVVPVSNTFGKEE